MALFLGTRATGPFQAYCSISWAVAFAHVAWHAVKSVLIAALYRPRVRLGVIFRDRSHTGRHSVMPQDLPVIIHVCKATCNSEGTEPPVEGAAAEDQLHEICVAHLGDIDRRLGSLAISESIT